MPASLALRCSVLLLGIAPPLPASASGQPDPSFGQDGALIIHADHAQPVGRESAGDLLIDSGGRYVTVGTAFKTNDSNRTMGLITRHHADGSPDPALDGVGFRHLEWQGKWTRFMTVRQTDKGTLMVLGHVSGENDFPRPLLCRLRDDGQLDLSFQTDGCRRLEQVHGNDGLTSFATDLELLPDGKMLVLGEPFHNPQDPRGFAVVRLLPDGNDDPSFGNASGCDNPSPGCGIAYSPQALKDAIYASDLTLDAQGRMLVGVDMNVGTFQLLTVLRYGASGDFELYFEAMNFDSLTDDPDTYHSARDVHALPNGSVLMTGKVDPLGEPPGQVAVARFLADGTHDPGFGNAGRITEIFDPAAADNSVRGSTLQSDGKLLVLGDSRAPFPWRCHVLRLDAQTGERDIAFGAGGVSTPATLNAMSPDDCYAGGVAADAHRIVVAGTSETTVDGLDDSNAFLLRLERDALFLNGFEP